MPPGALSYLSGAGLDFNDCVLKDLSPEQSLIFSRCKELFPDRLAAHPGLDRAKPISSVDDFCLWRFLKAEKWNVEKAIVRLLGTLRWRQENSIDCILTSAPPPLRVLEKYRRLRVRRTHGFDKEGRPVVYERLGEFFGSYRSKQLSLQEWLRCYAHDIAELEVLLLESSVRLQRPVTTLTFVGDLAGHRTLPMLRNLGLLKAFTKVVEVHFPELAGPLILVNSSPSSVRIWETAKRFLDPAVVSKITLSKGVPTELLLDTIDAASLPIEFGGECSFVVPHAQSSLFESDFLGTELDDRTVGFQVRFVAMSPEGESSEEDIVEFRMRDSAEGVERGEFVAPQAGALTLRWDNSHSILRSKIVHFNVDVFANNNTTAAVDP